MSAVDDELNFEEANGGNDITDSNGMLWSGVTLKKSRRCILCREKIQKGVSAWMSEEETFLHERCFEVYDSRLCGENVD